MPEEKKKQSLVRELFSWAATIIIALGAVLLIRNYLVINANVPSGSMENTIMPGDRLIGNRLAYIKEDPQRGDIIIFKYPDDETQNYIKRIIGLPGETVEIIDAEIYIDDSEIPLEEDYLKEEWTNAAGPYHFEVPEDSYLVLGDNRNYSKDARLWNNPYVAKDKIEGKAVFRYYPLQTVGTLHKPGKE